MPQLHSDTVMEKQMPSLLSGLTERFCFWGSYGGVHILYMLWHMGGVFDSLGLMSLPSRHVLGWNDFVHWHQDPLLPETQRKGIREFIPLEGLKGLLRIITNDIS